MRINGVELHVESPVGEGELLVLVHGGWTDHNTFAALIEPLSRSFRVVRYDRRGHSRSERGAGPPPRRADEDDLAALIVAFGGGPAHLVGTSYGAAISLALAGRRPELVRSVVAHEPPLLGLVPMPAVEAAFGSIQDQLASGDLAGGTRRFFEEVILGPGGWDMVPEPIRRIAIANAQTFIDLREDPKWGALEIAAVSRFPGKIVITRGDSGPGWLSHVALAVADLLGRDSSVIPGAGHSPHLTHPHAFAALILEIIGSEAMRPAA